MNIALMIVMIMVAALTFAPQPVEAKECKGKQIANLNKGGRVLTVCASGKVTPQVSYKMHLIQKLQARP